MRPVLLRPDNWTPPERTPWGGRAIAERWKAGRDIDPDKAAWPAIGESWELSFDPAFPSCDAAGTALADLIAADRRAWLGDDPRLAALGESLMVKLLDAKDALSVQVHPADDDALLGPRESGKPEAWVILAREPGAGLWLGLAKGVTREAFAAALDTGADGAVRPLLQFVPVEVGDVFVIDAGTVHAIGPGVTLLEPQLVRPGKSGVTYRFWDWGRRFDAHGRPDPAGEPRSLHRERSLAVAAWDAPRGDAFVAACRRAPRRISEHESHLFSFRGMRLDRLDGTGSHTLAPTATLRALTVTEGRIVVAGTAVHAGETLVLPAALGPLDLALIDAQGFVIAPD